MNMVTLTKEGNWVNVLSKTGHVVRGRKKKIPFPGQKRRTFEDLLD